MKERATHNNPSPVEPAAGREWDNRPEGRAIRLKTEERRRRRSLRGQKVEEEEMERPHGVPVEVTRVGGDATPPEENADLLGLTPECAHLLLQGVYGDFPHHNDWAHLDGGIADDAA